MVGRNAVLEALHAELPIKRAYVADGVERDDRLRDILRLAADRGISLLQATRSELDKITNGAVHQGIALQLPPYEYADPIDVLADALHDDEPGLVVALDHLTDPHNLGAIIRSAAAFGAHGVIIPERRSAQLTASAWKASAGAAARIPVAHATNLNRTMKTFADAGFTVVHLGGLGVDEVGGEFPGVAPEQDVGQGHVQPEEADEVQPRQQDDHGVQQPADGLGAHPVGEQRPVGQRELQVAGDEHRVQRLTLGALPPGDDRERLDAGRVLPVELLEHPVLVERGGLDDLLGRVHRPADLDEADDVAGDAAGQRHQVLDRPLRQGSAPGERDQPSIGLG